MKRLNRRRRWARSGLGLLEILVVVALSAIALAILLPTIFNTRNGRHGGSNRVKCGNNLKQIGTAIMMYSNENRGAFPRGIFKPDAPPTFHLDGSDAGKAVNPFVDAPWNGYDNDILMAMFLIIRTQDIGSEVFTCPQVDQVKDVYGRGANASAMGKASFTSLNNLSYSLANPYPSTAAEKLGYRWNSTLTSEFAIAADMNPGIGDGYDVTLPLLESSAKDKQRGNSRNHQGAGQNVLYGDMHVEFAQDPFVGMKRDNIYTVSSSEDGTGSMTSRTVVGIPKGPHDSVLLPAFK